MAPTLPRLSNSPSLSLEGLSLHSGMKRELQEEEGTTDEEAERIYFPLGLFEDNRRRMGEKEREEREGETSRLYGPPKAPRRTGKDITYSSGEGVEPGSAKFATLICVFLRLFNKE